MISSFLACTATGTAGRAATRMQAWRVASSARAKSSILLAHMNTLKPTTPRSSGCSRRSTPPGTRPPGRSPRPRTDLQPPASRGRQQPSWWVGARSAASPARWSHRHRRAHGCRWPSPPTGCDRARSGARAVHAAGRDAGPRRRAPPRHAPRCRARAPRSGSPPLQRRATRTRPAGRWSRRGSRGRARRSCRRRSPRARPAARRARRARQPRPPRQPSSPGRGSRRPRGAARSLPTGASATSSTASCPAPLRRARSGSTPRARTGPLERTTSSRRAAPPRRGRKHASESQLDLTLRRDPLHLCVQLCERVRRVASWQWRTFHAEPHGARITFAAPGSTTSSATVANGPGRVRRPLRPRAPAPPPRAARHNGRR